MEPSAQNHHTLLYDPVVDSTKTNYKPVELWYRAGLQCINFKFDRTDEHFHSDAKK